MGGTRSAIERGGLTYGTCYELLINKESFTSKEENSLPEIKDFINSQILPTAGVVQLFNIKTTSELIALPEISNLVNLQRINDIRWVNSFFETLNKKLPVGGTFISCVEIYTQRKRRIEDKYPRAIAVPYLGLSFIFNRVLPRLNLTKGFYSYLTKGNNRIMSKAEALGRLVACGFEILDTQYINNLFYFAVKKVKEPSFNSDPTFGFIIRMKRLGKDGKIINVYKVRTMHPYSEYLQGYIYKCNSVAEGGKFKDDFRIAEWGKIFRKLYIDELPMLINFVKRDLKLVGIRPLSAQYFNLYPTVYKERRLKYKPGLIPPYYADTPNTIEEITASEEKYLDQYDKHPLLTDAKYFFKIFNNIVFKGVRSK